MAAGIVASTLRRKAFHKRALHDSATRYQAIEPGHIGTAPSGQHLGGQGHGLLYSRTVLEDPIHGSHNGNRLLRPWLSGHIGTAPSLYQRTTPSRPRPEITVLKDSPQGRGQSSRTQSLVPTMETYYYGRGSLVTNTRNVFEYNTNARDDCTVEVEDSPRGSRPGQCVVARATSAARRRAVPRTTFHRPGELRRSSASSRHRQRRECPHRICPTRTSGRPASTLPKPTSTSWSSKLSSTYVDCAWLLLSDRVSLAGKVLYSASIASICVKMWVGPNSTVCW